MARIWYQSFVHPVEQAPYVDRLQALLAKLAAPGVVFEVHGLDPPAHSFHSLTEFRCAAQVIGNAIAAEKAGFNRGGLNGMLQSRLEEQKKLYQKDEIPAYALAETAALLGKKVEALAYLKASHQRNESEFAFIERDGTLGNLRDEPAYRRMVAELGLPVMQ